MPDYRKATLADAETLALARLAFLSEIHPDMSEAERAELLRQNLCYLHDSLGDGSFAAHLAYDGDELVATSGVSFYRLPPNGACPSGRVAYISNMYTMPSHRGRGIATRLFELTLREAAARGHTKLLLNATAMGRPIYEKFGFQGTQNDMVFYIREEPRA